MNQRMHILTHLYWKCVENIVLILKYTDISVNKKMFYHGVCNFLLPYQYPLFHDLIKDSIETLYR